MQTGNWQCSNNINTANDAVIDEVFKDQVTSQTYAVEAGDKIELEIVQAQ